MQAAETLFETIRSVLPKKTPIALHEPQFLGNEKKYVNECLDTGWVSSVGKFVDRFEKDLCDFTGSSHAIVTVNGTAALHIALVVAGVTRDDEVLVPALTFIATANAVSYTGADVHLVDSEETTLGVDLQKLDRYLAASTEIKGDHSINKKTGRVIRAFVPMHAFGLPIDLDQAKAISAKYKLILIEDAAESLGSYFNGVHTGLSGKMSTLSFNGNKPVTTGGGGAVLTQDAQLAKRLKHLTTTAKRPHAWEYFHDELGYNYRLPNINAALGCAQMEILPRALEKKRALSMKYHAAFEGLKEFGQMVREPQNTKSNYWLNALLLSQKHAGARDSLLELGRINSIQMRPAWTLMHELPMYAQAPRMELSQCEDISRRLINLPSSPFLVDESGAGP